MNAAVRIPFIGIVCLIILVGCASQMRGARLEPGEIGVDLSLSGPIATNDGVYPIPYPTIGVKYGAANWLQIGIGYVPVLHIFRPLAIFHVLEGKSAIPFVDIAVEAGFRTDFKFIIFYPRIDIAVGWDLKPFRPYIEVGIFGDSYTLSLGGAPLFSMSAGINWRALPWLDMNLGVMYWGINADYGFATTSGSAYGTPWVATPGGRGLIGINLGFGLILATRNEIE